MGNYFVEASNLKKSFGPIPAVDGVSLQIKAGEIYGLVGADGAGKTTTMRLLVGALKADVGEINICGYDINRQTEKARSQFGYLSQRFSLYEDLTVLENIRFFAEVRGLRSDEWLPRSLEILEFVGLSDFKDRRAGQLSGGMKQKLGLASALVTRPRVLLLDEPTTGVDPVTRQDFWQLVIKLVSPSPSGGGMSEGQGEGESLFASYGVMGGFMQPQGHVQVLSALVDDGLDPQSALDLPRFCIDVEEARGRVALEEGIPAGVIADLEQRGHPVYSVTGYDRSLFGRGQVILRDAETGVLVAGSDPRADGCAMTLT